MAEGRDNKQQGTTTVTSARGARRRLWRWLPFTQQHGQQEHELAVLEGLFIADEISAKVNVTVPTQILGTHKHPFSGNCYCLAQDSFMVLVSAWDKGCPSFTSSISTDWSCPLEQHAHSTSS